MHIILSGKHGSPLEAVAEALKRKWGSAGTAVYVHDAKAPVKLMRDAIHSVAQQFGYAPAEENPDLFLQQAMLDWGREQDVKFWGKAAKRQVDQTTSIWERAGAFYVVVIHGLCFREDYELFPRAYRVYLLPPSDYKPPMIQSHHPSETALDPWVEESRKDRYPKFDEIISPDGRSIEEIGKIIVDGFTERFKSGFRPLMN